MVSPSRKLVDPSSPALKLEWLAVKRVLGLELMIQLMGIPVSSARRYVAGTRATPNAVAARLHFLATRRDTVSIPPRNRKSASRKTITPGAVTRGERNETASRFGQPRLRVRDRPGRDRFSQPWRPRPIGHRPALVTEPLPAAAIRVNTNALTPRHAAVVYA